jgi:hypothetical protein
MKSYLSLHRAVLSVVLASCLAAVPAAAAEETPTINRERLWLPPSSAHLMPMLVYAAELALSSPECQQVLYGRLNEFRSDQGEEPVLTILCQQDPRTTFNMVYQASELEAALGNTSIEFSSEDPTSNLEALRQLLMSNAELMEQDGDRPDDTANDATEAAADGLDLELELDDLMRDRPRQSEEAPELF